jgi:UDP-N-acetylmuramoyl-L-alanyl-D-glutamate--2,6-diaminopimelate ligase
MKAECGLRRSGFGGAPRFDPRVVAALGIRRLTSDSRSVRRGDVVLLAGKGHEAGQEVRSVRRPFGAAAVAREERARRAP